MPAIDIGGKTYRTLADPIYLKDGRQVKEVWIRPTDTGTPVKVYPETVEPILVMKGTTSYDEEITRGWYYTSSYRSPFATQRFRVQSKASFAISTEYLSTGSGEIRYYSNYQSIGRICIYKLNGSMPVVRSFDLYQAITVTPLDPTPDGITMTSESLAEYQRMQAGLYNLHEQSNGERTYYGNYLDAYWVTYKNGQPVEDEWEASWGTHEYFEFRAPFRCEHIIGIDSRFVLTGNDGSRSCFLKSGRPTSSRYDSDEPELKFWYDSLTYRNFYIDSYSNTSVVTEESPPASAFIADPLPQS